ncbi:MAG: hypothetical protein WDN03_11380 [Rhizomicrobium sp.]
MSEVPRIAASARVSPATRDAASGSACADSARVDVASSRTSRPRSPTSTRSNGKTKSAAGA